MTHMELVEKLRQSADVTFEEAKAALEQTNWDLLDAVVLLERQGKVHENPRYSTCENAAPREESAAQSKTGFFRRTWDTLARLLERGNKNSFVAARPGAGPIVVPALLFFLLLVLAFWVMVPLLVVGLFCGYRFSFSGPDLGKDVVNSAMGKATDVADTLKQEFTDAYRKRRDQEHDDIVLTVDPEDETGKEE